MGSGLSSCSMNSARFSSVWWISGGHAFDWNAISKFLTEEKIRDTKEGETEKKRKGNEKKNKGQYRDKQNHDNDNDNHEVRQTAKEQTHKCINQHTKIILWSIIQLNPTWQEGSIEEFTSKGRCFWAKCEQARKGREGDSFRSSTLKHRIHSVQSSLDTRWSACQAFFKFPCWSNNFRFRESDCGEAAAAAAAALICIISSILLSPKAER